MKALHSYTPFDKSLIADLQNTALDIYERIAIQLMIFDILWIWSVSSVAHVNLFQYHPKCDKQECFGFYQAKSEALSRNYVSQVSPLFHSYR